MKRFYQTPLFLKDKRGQVLPFSFGLTLLCLIFGLYFFYEAEFFEEYGEDLQGARESLFKNTYNLSNKLNEIAFNNQNIIASLSLSLHGFSHAIESGADLADSCPYWEDPRDYFYNKKKLPYQLNSSNFKRDGYIEKSKIMNDIQEVLNSIELRVSRGIFLAHLFHKKNEQIIKSFPISISSFFSYMSEKESMCLVLKSQKDFFKSRIIKIPFKDKWIDINDCSIILNKKSKISISPPAEEIGPFLVRVNTMEKESINEFLSHLIFKEDVFYKNKDEFRKLLTGIMKYISPISKQRVRTTIQTRITHPRVLCIEGKEGVLTRDRDFELCRAYHLKKFQAAFFDPRWTPIMGDGKKW